MTLDIAVYTAIIDELKRMERTGVCHGSAHDLAQKLAALVADGGNVCLASERDEARQVAREYRTLYWSAVAPCKCEDCATLYAREKAYPWLTETATEKGDDDE